MSGVKNWHAHFPGLEDLSGLRTGTAAHVLGQLERLSLLWGLLTLQFLQDGAVQTFA